VSACDGCLRRSWLVGSLSASIEQAISGLPAARSRELLGLTDEHLAEAVGGDDSAAFLHRARTRDAGRLRTAIQGARVWAACRHDPLYPASLRDLSDAPAILFGRGDPKHLERLGEPAVTVVGTRRPSSYGREIAFSLGWELGAAGVPVISGMANGVDSRAHEGALQARGFTVAVLGSGPDVPSPAGRARLHERIADDGLVLSELPPGTNPRRWTFPARNRIMAALGRMTVVVEGRARSGSLITSSMAEDLGRDVGAVPGRVGNPVAEGTNQLLADGAHVIRGGRDVLDALLGPGQRSCGAPVGESLEPELASALEAVDRGAATGDEVARASGLAAGAALSALVRLELAGLVICDGAGRYERSVAAAGSRGGPSG